MIAEEGNLFCVRLDFTVINYTSVDGLVQILPKLGDRIALKVFVDEEIKKKQESRFQEKERKTKLIQTLRAKLGIVKTRHCHDTVPTEFQDKCTSESS
ncbi:hypothetical protein CHS0354_038536 [Potamilus streckersoni]|uniref:Uncharacterized protein n=1 Tax=Potamilus streckersoni TaxID=2493646 RepID=A0AAE0S5X9_9BIVA|nr:hypothetical protein CHS0354_038536 [Potamilus streckersoni]